MTTEYEKAMDAQPVAWVAADTLNFPHPVCISSLAYVSQLDKDRGREYVPLYAAPVAAQGEDDALDAARYRWLRYREIPEWLDLWHQNPDRIDAAIDQARGNGGKEVGNG